MGRQRASCRALPGNLTVEAAIALPLFLFAVINLLSLFLMFQEFSVQEGRLHQTGRMLSMLAHGQESGEAGYPAGATERVEPLIPVAGFPKTFVASGCVMHKWIGFALGEEEGNGAARIGRSWFYHLLRNRMAPGSGMRLSEPADRAVVHG